MTDSANQPPYEEAAAFLKLLANPNRLAVLCKLHERPHNVTELAEAAGLPQAAMSSQLALLREARVGVLRGQPPGAAVLHCRPTGKRHRTAAVFFLLRPEKLKRRAGQTGKKAV